AEATAHGDALGAIPRLCLQEAAHHESQLLSVLLDRALDDCNGLEIFSLLQHLVELGTPQVIRGRAADWVGADLAQRLAPVLQNLVECLAARAIAEKALVVLQFEVV